MNNKEAKINNKTNEDLNNDSFEKKKKEAVKDDSLNDKLKKKTKEKQINDSIVIPRVKRMRFQKNNLIIFLLLAIIALVIIGGFLFNSWSQESRKISYVNTAQKAFQEAKSAQDQLETDILMNFGVSISENDQNQEGQTEKARNDSLNLAENVVKKMSEIKENLPRTPEGLSDINTDLQNYIQETESLAQEYSQLNRFFIAFFPLINEFSSAIDGVNFDGQLQNINEVESFMVKIDSTLPRLKEIKEELDKIETVTDKTVRIKKITLSFIEGNIKFLEDQKKFLEMKKEALTQRSQRLENEAIEFELKTREQYDEVFENFIDEQTTFDENIIAEYQNSIENLNEIEVQIEQTIEDAKQTE